jgi:hypothetical protein
MGDVQLLNHFHNTLIGFIKIVGMVFQLNLLLSAKWLLHCYSSK